MFSDLYTYDPAVHTRWASFENPSAAKGLGGKSNGGRKGAAFAPLPAGESLTLLDLSDCSGVVRRIWLTVSDRSPRMLRSLRIECFWDGADTPAVSVPLGDFFGIGLGRMAPFESELFCSPEGRSFCCFVPMPFRSAARIVLTNDNSPDEKSGRLSHVFYDVNLTLEPVPENALYFHALFRRERSTNLGNDFMILPRVHGRGRFLGTNIGVISNPAYRDLWWGEGEFKCFLDGDSSPEGVLRYPTLCGTGTEDYISTAWGQGAYSQRYHGSTIADGKSGHWCFYRHHVRDPIVFHRDCLVTLQQIGGGPRQRVQELLNSVKSQPAEDGILQSTDPALQVISADIKGHFVPLADPAKPATVADLPEDCWLNFLREDDVSATAYFYLDRPDGGGRDPMPDLETRVAGLEFIKPIPRQDG